MPDFSRASPDTAFATCAAGAFALWALWCLAALAVAVVDRRLAARIAPPLLRGLLVAGTVAATAVPASAAESGRVLDGLRLPERPVSSTSIAPAAPEPQRPRTHVVRPGDCLWSIARARLPDADDAELARQVERWHAANRDLIGSDPDVLLPGQELVPPQEHHDHRHGPRDDSVQSAPGAPAVPGEGPAAPGARGAR